MPRPRLVPDPATVIGLMSGTSADGVDAALCRVGSNGGEGLGLDVREVTVTLELVAARTFPYDEELRPRLHSAAELTTPELAALNAELGERFAAAAAGVCGAVGASLADVDLIGSHGQTVWHDPDGSRAGRPTTLQLGEPAVIAARTGRDVVADFRPADVALGGQGAPLVPLVDFLLLRSPGEDRAVLNLGGIANVTWLPGDGAIERVVAFDTGPGNMPLDGLVRRFGLAPEGHDPGGGLALSGRVHAGLLEELLAEPFFARTPPRSTGRELFGEAFVERVANRGAELGLEPRDLLATGAALTARSSAEALLRFCGRPAALLLCGGGRRNAAVRAGLSRLLPGVALRDTDDEGLDGDAKEAVAFAVLAWLAARGIANHLPRTTGASRAAILGKFVWGGAP